MIKSFIEKKLKSFLAFVEINFKIRFGNKSAVDIYYDELQKNCYEFFKKDMQESSIFLKVEDIRNFSIYRAIQGLNNSPDSVRSRERNPAARGMEKELISIRKELTVIANKIREDENVRQVESEWKFAAMVMDRLCLIIFTTFTIALFAALLILAPKIIVL